MAAVTVSAQLSESAYTLVASGKANVVLRVYTGGQTHARVHVGQSLPDADTDHWFPVGNEPLRLEGLAADDNIYIRAESGNLTRVNVLAWTEEQTAASYAVDFVDDFLGNALNTVNWGTRDTGGATETVSADAGNGAVALALTSTNEAQLAGIDWADQRTLVLNQGLIFEARAKLSVLPTGSVVAVLGLCGDHNAAVNTVAESIWFRADGNGVITVETDDGVTETSQVATGVTLTTADWAVFRIDCSDPTNIKFYINGNRVASGTTFSAAAVPALALQPVARIGKESAATTVGTMLVDYVRVQQRRAA